MINSGDFFFHLYNGFFFIFDNENFMWPFLQERSCEDVGDEESAICTVSFGPHPRFSSGGGSLMRLKCSVSALLRSMKSTTKMLLQKVIEGTLFSY